jgi:hypothetical protein
MANPLVPQGTINRLRASVTVTNFTGLNVTASYLGKEGISLSFDGVVTTPIETMTGIVPSPEPYQRVTANIHLLKTQALATAWKQQLERLSLIGQLTVQPDAVALDPYQISNSYIYNVAPLKFDGTDAGWVVSVGGIYYVNSDLWNQ